MEKLTHQEIVARQKLRQLQAAVPVTVLLNDIRSLYNVGAIFRTADGAGMEKLCLCGFTGCPPQAQILKTALGAEERVPWQQHSDALAVARDLRSRGYQLVALEQTRGSVSYSDFQPRGPVCLIIGNETDGVSEQLMDLCDCSLEIEMAGIKNSLNVAVAFGIVAYYLRGCFQRVDHC